MIPGATLPNTNETLSRKHLENVERKLSRNEKLKEEYNGGIEEAPPNPSGESILHATQTSCKANCSHHKGSHGV